MKTLPVSPREAAARALGLSALVCREILEQVPEDPKAAEMHTVVLRWLRDSGAIKGLESMEINILTAPLGSLERDGRALAYWRVEQLTVLAWALGKVPPPAPWERYSQRLVAGRVGFLRQDAAMIIASAALKPTSELAMFAAHNEEARSVFEQGLHDPDAGEEVKTAFIAAVERRKALDWMLGETALALEAPLLA